MSNNCIHLSCVLIRASVYSTGTTAAASPELSNNRVARSKYLIRTYYPQIFSLYYEIYRSIHAQLTNIWSSIDLNGISGSESHEKKTNIQKQIIDHISAFRK